jgi:hypothetical protein
MAVTMPQFVKGAGFTQTTRTFGEGRSITYGVQK